MTTLTIAEHFKKHGWAYVPNLVRKSECKMLTDYLFLLKEQGKTKSGDYQCPLSDAMYGEQFLDLLLENLCPKISKLIDIPLIPTYSYSRIYRTGEVLDVHKDRESCEISATITLGHSESSGIWPIYFSAADDLKNPHRQIIEVGGAVIYRGMDIWHWRQKYRGKWQTQIFTHYVDANGKNVDKVYDGRDKLGSSTRVRSIDS